MASSHTKISLVKHVALLDMRIQYEILWVFLIRLYHIIIYEGDVSANTTPPKNVENIEIVKTASRPVWHPGGCIGASNGASTALKLPGKPEIHVFFVRLYTYSGP